MPFVPSYTYAPQRQAFANRLAFHLAPTTSRQSLMALQEAFAKAGGFPDAHAAKKFWQKQGLFQQLMGASPVPEEGLMAFRFLGVGPAKLFQWSKESLNKHSSILEHHPFGQSDAEELLTALWKHVSWKEALIFQAPHKRRPEHQWSYLMTAPTLDRLNEEAWKFTVGSSSYGRAAGLYCTWGQRTSDNHWVGQIWDSARNHALLVQDNADLRYRTVMAQVTQRLAQQDTVIVLDASPEQALLAPIVREASSQGQTVHVIDWTGETLDPVGFFDLPLAYQHHLFLDSFGHEQRDHQNPFSTRVNEDDGLFHASNISMLEKFEAFTQGFQTNSQITKNLFSKRIVVWKLPAETQAPKRLRLAMGLLKFYISQSLNSAEDDEVFDPLSIRPPSQTNNTAIFSVDVPLSYHPNGMAAMYAQARAKGVIVLDAQSTPMIRQNNTADEVKASIANMSTKVVSGPRQAMDPLWGQLGLTPKALESKQARIICASDDEIIFLTIHSTGANQ